MATARTHKDIVQQGIDALNDRDRDAFVELHAEDAVLHDTDEEYQGIDDIAEVEFTFFDAFPDLTLTLEEMVADGDTVTARWRATGTHEGEFEGIEPTGEEFEIPVMGTFRIEDERVAEIWLLADRLGLMQQLGVVERPGA